MHLVGVMIRRGESCLMRALSAIFKYCMDLFAAVNEMPHIAWIDT
jgi:hypothetical protein